MKEKVDDITLINGDCMDYMRGLPDNAFDLAVVDPPYGGAGQSGGEYCRFGGRFEKYGVGRTGGTWAEKYGNKIKSWDIAPSDEYFKELFRVSRNQVIFGGNYFRLPRPVVFLSGGNCLFQKISAWQWPNTHGLRSTATPRSLNVPHKVRKKSHAYILVKSP